MAVRAPRARGFTLLEMLLVVALLAATAGMSMAMLGQREQQARYDQTVRRLDDAVHAVVGQPGPVWEGEMRLSGFVVDNGRLPTSLLELTGRDALVDGTECANGGGATAAGLLSCHRPRAAVFDPSPAPDTGLNNDSGDEVVLAQPAESLGKGLRRYLVPRTGGHVWRDGWANVAIGSDDGSNFGWQLTLPAAATDSWVLTSLGSNNAPDAAAPASDPELVADLSRSLVPEDWSVDVQGWTVRLTNASGATLPSSGYLGVSLLVWRNLPGGGRWLRLTSTLDGTPLAAGESRDFSFPAGGHPGGALSTRIPIGEHLLLAITSADATAHDADDAPLTVGGHRVSAQLRFFGGATRPRAELVLR